MDAFGALLTLTDLTAVEFSIAVIAVFAAGLVRGFSGFALSAMVMASLALLIPPVELIAICWFLELSASLLMVRKGFAQADMKMVLGLFLGGLMGVPIGLYFTNTLPVDTSRMIALVIIMALALSQLLRLRPKFLATGPGLIGSGLTAGIATGLAGVGGMVVALYVLARDAPAAIMRSSMVMYLFIGSATSFIYLWLYDMVTIAVVSRALVFVPVVIVGVLIGKWLFQPKLEPYYKPFCLVLLMALASAGLLRLLGT
ncbi:MAG: TSUP family transporter [Pseudomonadota bacterium]